VVLLEGSRPEWLEPRPAFGGSHKATYPGQ